MNRGNRNHSESGRGGRRGGGVGGGVFRGGPPNRGDDRLTRADVSHKLKQDLKVDRFKCLFSYFLLSGSME